jgi:hypothetical protein
MMRDKPIISFVVLTFLFSWSVWLTGYLLGEKLVGAVSCCRNYKKSRSDAVSSFVIGVIWACWHIPLFLSGVYTNPMFQYFIMLIVLSFLFTSLSNISKRSVWPLVMFHASFNSSNLMIGTVYPADGGFEVKDWNYLIVLLAVIILGV